MLKFDNNNNYNNPDKKVISTRVKNDLKDGKTVSVLFAGVGGQGIILATTLLARTAILEGYDVKVSEVHGMAQRGGSVEGSVRMGRKVYSPTIGKADFIVALEKLEGLRFIDRLDRRGVVIINDYEIYPSTVNRKNVSYPDNIEDMVRKYAGIAVFTGAFEIAKQLNDTRVANTVLLGVLSGYLPLCEESWEHVIADSMPVKVMELNLKAFKAGRNLI
jgi:indolepyruvate ferredoxin oxidoreductase, beta subunit